MDFRAFEAINDLASAHASLARSLAGFDNVLVVSLVIATLALWLVAPPGGPRKWKRAATGALAAGALAYGVNQLVHLLWDRPRPYESHDGVWHASEAPTDASFPSDHTSAAFGIAWLVFLYDRAVGAAFLLLAGLLAWIRVLVGFHYPGDVLAGMAVGLGAALLVHRFGDPLLQRLVAVVERGTDPVLRPLRRR
jgi:undecaprenyl-diphosphatase